MATVEPIVVIFLGITFLNEAFAPIRVVGAAVVLAGVLLAQFATPSEARPVVLEEP
jgi:drug/metabolite transporter (DMT)-like permease